MVAAADIAVPNVAFAQLPSRERVTRVAAVLEANAFNVVVVDTPEQAKIAALALVPEGAVVFDALSQTLEAIGVAAEVNESGRYQPVRPKLMELYANGDRAGMRVAGATPDVMLGSVHAITEGGELIVGSGSGSQLGPYAYTAGAVVLVAGAQKIVRNVDEGLRRLREYSLPRESERMMAFAGQPSSLNKILILNREFVPGRTTVILVNAELGF